MMQGLDVRQTDLHEILNSEHGLQQDTYPWDLLLDTAEVDSLCERLNTGNAPFEEGWVADDVDGHYLTTTMKMLGGLFHVEAFAVSPNGTGYFETDPPGDVLCAAQASKVHAVVDAFFAEEFQTVKIDGFPHDYVVIVTPFDK